MIIYVAPRNILEAMELTVLWRVLLYIDHVDFVWAPVLSFTFHTFLELKPSNDVYVSNTSNQNSFTV